MKLSVKEQEKLSLLVRHPEKWVDKQCRKLCVDDDSGAEFICQRTKDHEGHHLALPGTE